MVSDSDDLHVGKWKRKYAYFPKKIDGRWIWLDEYWWREIWVATGTSLNSHEWRKEYGTLFDVISGI